MLGRSTLLLVAADPVRRLFATEEGEEYELLEAGSVEAAHEILTSQMPDCVLLGDLLPDGEGDVMRLIPRLEGECGHPFRPVILLTRANDDMRRVQALQAGAQDYISLKGLFGSDLALAIRSAIERHRRIRELHDAEKRIQCSAWLCPQTGLPNRHLFDDRLSQALSHARRSGERAAVFFVEIQGLGSISQKWGELVAEELLKALVGRLVSACRESDTVARLGSGEFGLVVQGVVRPSDAARVAQRVLACLTSDVRVDGRVLRASVRIGIALFPDDARGRDELMCAATAAAECSGSRSEGGYRFHSSEVGRASSERLTQERRLRAAIEGRELTLHYQPKVDAVTGSIVGAEALVRWQHPELGLIAPNEFIPLAEETGLIVELGAWVLAEACRTNRSWQEAGLPSVSVAVNVSARQLSGPDFSGLVQETLRATRMEVSQLELEITESLLIHDPDATAALLESVRSLGIRIAVDDFGTGYSSLALLQRLPIDVLKIDRSFIEGVPGSCNDEELTRAIIALSLGLGQEVVAEGIETIEQRDFLLEHGCRTQQGFLFSPPLTDTDFRTLLAHGSIRLKGGGDMSGSGPSARRAPWPEDSGTTAP